MCPLYILLQIPQVEYRDACDAVDLDAAIARVRADVAQRGLTAAVTVVQTFVEMDDDMDNMIDVGEFRRACAICNVKFLDSEEEVCSKLCLLGIIMEVGGSCDQFFPDVA